MIGRLAFIALLATGPAAHAQDAESPPATAEQIASARETADRLIADADAGAFFVNKTDGAVPTVVHVASGLTCLFSGGPEERISIFPTGPAGIARGEDVGCVSRVDELGIDLNLYATRYQPLPSEELALRQAVNAIRQRWPDARPFDGELVSVSSDGEDAPLQAAYTVTVNNEPMITLALVEHRKGWGYKARGTGPGAEPMLISLYTAMAFKMALDAQDAE
ncbi:hypothetical protein [Brevundimonas sp. Root1279]|uniref:hypothetical protein n=1 Tax=Brevundimonas sp. Root1279 TaxID=1736443 RepID=UPI0006F96210|nr:hypothetical protein [Brevundimonas sp. Root1279]KQW83098.1 hypothetical protein ASC65_07125 [Brevundimonas sp. Root1279]